MLTRAQKKTAKKNGEGESRRLFVSSGTVGSAASLQLLLAGLFGIRGRHALIVLLLFSNTLLHSLLAGCAGGLLLMWRRRSRGARAVAGRGRFRCTTRCRLPL